MRYHGDVGHAWIRLNGKAVFEDNRAAKEMCIANPIAKGRHPTADNPIFEGFYLDDPHGGIADFSSNPPYTFGFLQSIRFQAGVKRGHSMDLICSSRAAEEKRRGESFFPASAHSLV
ncbi:MAG: hypothetical protein IJ662_06430 [Clostridia bacterium]|nr:hypothetical protein [Clostridia bacterium]